MSQYLTVAELIEGPLGADWGGLPSRQQNTPAGVTLEQNYQRVQDIIVKSSGMVDAYCNQILSATLDTEEKWTETRDCGVDNNGYLWVRPDYFPIISVQSFQFGLPVIGGTTWQVAAITDLAVIGDLKSQIIYPTSLARRNRPPYRVQYTYLNGYVTALLTAAVTAGATSLPLSDLTGITAGQKLTVYDGGNTEVVTVSSTWVAALGAGSVTLATGTTYAHAPHTAPFTPANEPYDIMVSNLPAEIKLAVMMVCKFVAELRGSTALIAPGARTQSGNRQMKSEIPQEARDILDRYAQVF